MWKWRRSTVLLGCGGGWLLSDWTATPSPLPLESRVGMKPTDTREEEEEMENSTGNEQKSKTKSVRGFAPDTPTSCAQLDQPMIDSVKGDGEMQVTCERCGRLVQAIVFEIAAAMSKEDAMDYGEELGVVYDDFVGYCECDLVDSVDEFEAFPQSPDRVLAPVASRLVTRWEWVGEIGDLLLDGTDWLWSWFRRQSDEAQSALWASYFELGAREDRERPVATRVERVVKLVPVDDVSCEVVAEDVVVEARSVFAEALEAEWAARVPLVGGAGGAGSIGEDSASAELNRLVEADERLARASRRVEEALVVVDRRAVTVVPPRVMRTGPWDFERGEHRAEPVTAENRRIWNESPEQARARAEAIVAKLKARGVPVRTWRPDNRTEQQKRVDSFRYWKADRQRRLVGLSV